MPEIEAPVETTGPTAPQVDDATPPEGEGGSPADGDQLIAGKFKSQDDLVKAYKELEAKLGNNAGDADASADEQQEDGDKETKPDDADPNPIFAEKTDEDRSWENEAYGEAVASVLDKAGIHAKNLAAEYEKNGTLPDDAYSALEEQGFHRQMVDQYLAGGPNTAASAVDEIMSSVGGEAEYGKMTQWMAQSLSQDELARFNAVVDSGDQNAIKYAVDSMNVRYKQAVGSEPELIQSNNTNATVDKFTSTQEAVEARKDPRYETDPAYREQVRAKLMNSDIFLSR
jgi:hypothetical protein